MKNILLCFLTSLDSEAAIKIAEKHFGSFSIVKPKNINSITSSVSSPETFLTISPEINQQLISDITTLSSEAQLSILPILILDKPIEITDLPSSSTFAFEIILSTKKGYEQAGEMLEMYYQNKQLENQLAENNRKYNTLVNNLPGVTYRCINDSDWTMLNLSRKMEKLTGYPVRSFIHNKILTYSDIILPQDREHVWLSIQKAIKKNLSFSIEYRIKTAQGRVKWMREQGRQIIGEDGEHYLEGVITDIDDQKNLEKRIELMRDLVLAINKSNDLPGMIEVIKEVLGKIILANDFKLSLFDWGKREFLIPFIEDNSEYYKRVPMSKTLDALVIKRNRSIFLQRLDIQKLERQGKITLIGPAPKVWLGVPVQIDGKASGIISLQEFENEFAINKTDMDLLEFISVQVGASIQKKRTEDKSMVLLQAIEQNPIPVMITDLKGHIVYANNKAATIRGNTIKEMLGKIPNIIDPYKSDPEHFSSIWNTLKETGTWQGEFKNTNSAGESCWEYAYISSIKNSRNNTTHYIYIKEEITKRKQNEAEIRKAKQSAEDSNKLKTKFLSNISYEIRTPMNAIIGFTEMLRTSNYSEEEHEEFFDLIIGNSKKLLNTIDNIIDVAKIEAGEMSISSSKCSANKILYDNYYNFEKVKNKIDRAHIKFIPRQYVQDENLLFVSDPVRINQVLENLLGNAFKYTTSGSIEFGYTLLEENEGKFIDFYVKDTGMGISDQEKDSLFNTTTPVGNNYMATAVGSELRLSISRNIAQLMHGDIRLESNPVKGSEFHFVLPYNPVLETDVLKSQGKPKVEKKEINWPDKTVLITEDEDSNFKLLEVMLRKTKVKIERAFNGKQAVNYVMGGNDVDLILMDVRMPVMNGYEATEHIKKFDPNIPVIIQTAFALSADRENSFGAGCDEYLSKPIKATELYKLMKQFLDK